MNNNYRVLGMTCQGCANAVTKAITSAVAGTTVAVDLENKFVAVSGSDDTQAVQAAVEDAGFEFAGQV